ncbi:unnamed protein product [Moneuplotes crassus]|uniref:Uncharacterized protein n=1 Tax=Euplotes crassus TaxID=5936 RepID=A0AAD2DAK5_EUPCR|nr:unnamed protein product [Moneuplotes crassus]
MIIQPILDSQSIGSDMTNEIVQKTLNDISHKDFDKMTIPYGIEHAIISSSCHLFSQDLKVDDCFLEEDDEPQSYANDCFIPNKLKIETKPGSFINVEIDNSDEFDAESQSNAQSRIRSTRSGRTFRDKPKRPKVASKIKSKANGQVKLDPKDLPDYYDYQDNLAYIFKPLVNKSSLDAWLDRIKDGSHSYRDPLYNITSKDLDILRDTLERIKKNKIEMEKELKSKREIKAKGQKMFENKIQKGLLTYDHKGKIIPIRQVKPEKLPADFKQLLAHSMQTAKKPNKRNKKSLKIQKKQTFRNTSEGSKDKSLIQTYKNTKLVKSYLKSTINSGMSKDGLTISPSDGVAFIPDPTTREKIQGRPYKYKLRQFQKEFMENRGRRNQTLLDTNTFEEMEDIEEDEDTKLRNKNLSLDFASEHLIQSEGIIQEDKQSKSSPRSNSMRNSKQAVFNSRMNSNRSQIPILNKEYSFISTNLNSKSIKKKLMNYEPNSSINDPFDELNIPVKTSLMLPPLTIGNMQKTVDSRNLNNQSLIGSNMTFRNNSNDFGTIINRSKISIKSNMKNRMRNISAPKAKIFTRENSPSQFSEALPDISMESSKPPLLAKMPQRLKRSIHYEQMTTKDAPLTKKTRKQIDLLKAFERSKMGIRPKLINRTHKNL